MRRTYWIKYTRLGETLFDKVVYNSVDERPSWHKAGALTAWKKTNKGYGYLRINSVFTKKEMEEIGYAVQ